MSWTNGGTQDYSAIGGLIPYNDAAAYFDGAERLLQDGTLTIFSGRRPLNVAFFAARLLVSDQNIYVAIILQATVLAVALFVAFREMARTQGLSIALVFFAINFAFANNCLARTLSEALGMSLGLLSFTLYCSSIARKSKTEYAIATFILTLGLLARAGAMLALAGSLIFAIFFFANSWKARLSAFGVTLAAIALALLVNTALIRMYGNGGLFLSNFSYVIYGLARGGVGWQQAAKDFTLTGNEAEIAALLYQKTLESILTSPHLLIIGLVKSFLTSIVYFPAGLLRLIGEAIDGGAPRSLIPSVLAGMMLIPPLLYGAWRLLTRKPFYLDPLQLFILVQLIAFLASLPFFYLDGGIRLTAVTYPFTAAAIVLMLAACKPSSAIVETAPVRGSRYTAVAIASLVVITSLAAPRFHGMRSDASIGAAACDHGERQIAMLVGSGTAHINILNDDATSVLPNIRRSDFRVAQSSEIKDFWNNLSLPATVLLGLDHTSLQSELAVGPAGFADGPRRVAALCAKPLSDGVLSVHVARNGG